MSKFNIGDRVTLRESWDPADSGNHPTPHCWPDLFGKVATVTKTLVSGAPSIIKIKWEDDTPSTAHWHDGWFDKVEPQAPGRPLVHFDDEKAGRDRSRARAACSEAISTCLKDEHNALLLDASMGKSVDAYALNEAITAAIRSAATRLGHSTRRKEQASRFAHVAHIVQAVLENHADNLPGYEPGARSRLVEDLTHEVSDLRLSVERHKESRQIQWQRAEDFAQNVSDLRAEVETIKQAASDERRRLCDETDTARANLAQTVREANEFEATLAFVRQFLTPQQINQMTGFQLGFRVGASDD